MPSHLPPDGFLFPDLSTACELPLYLVHISAGFPSPAEDYIEGGLDLNRYLIKHPAANFYVRVTGDSMIGAPVMVLSNLGQPAETPECRRSASARTTPESDRAASVPALEKEPQWV